MIPIYFIFKIWVLEFGIHLLWYLNFLNVKKKVYFLTIWLINCDQALSNILHEKFLNTAYGQDW